MKSHHETGHSELTETEEWTDSHPPQQETSGDDKNMYTEINDLNFPLEQATEDNKNIYIEIDDLSINLEKTTSEKGNNESIELDEYDGTQKDEDSDDQFKETPPTGEYTSMRQ